jgi:ABC-type branched-subunit amino acid transport system ATPase component/sugar phosphate permease
MKSRFSRVVGSGPTYPMLILFGLNAVDELDRTAFAILAPEIRDEFGLGFQGLLTLTGVVIAFALALQVPIAGLADKMNRVHLAIIGALVWSVFSFMTGLATSIVFLAFMRSGSAIGKGVIDPTHNSLISDWYEPNQRPAVFSFHRAGNSIGIIFGALFAGLLGFSFGWRVPFMVFAIPTVVLAFLALRLKDPVRGRYEREAAGADEEAALLEEEPPSMTEAWRLCWKVETLRRIFFAMPFLAVSIIGFGVLASLFYEDVFGLDERARGFIAAGVEPAQLIGLAFGASVGVKLISRDPALILRFLALAAFVGSVFVVGFALSPTVWMAVGFSALISFSFAILGPGLIAALSLAIPPRARAMGFSMGSLWALPGLFALPLVGWVGDEWGIRVGMLVMTPILLIGMFLISSAAGGITRDIEQVRASARARSEAALARQRGEAKLLITRDVQVSYDKVQVLFGIDIDIGAGEIVALLGTNGAGKSTLLKAISGVTESDRGAIVLDGRDITHAPPNEIAALGIAQLPGGNAIFSSLTVKENIEASRWLSGSSGKAREGLVQTGENLKAAEALDLFPEIQERWNEPAANLSGGQQQMLGLAMALHSTPKVLMIDELSLGLAPAVVERLLPVIRRIAENGTAVIVVEQSVNLALTIAERAYFMEKGQIRFSGSTKELLKRPDLLRSVFLSDVQSTLIEPMQANVSSGQVVLQANGLTRHFGGIRAVDSVSLAVEEKTILGIMGPNGAGKTTLFDLLSGFVPLDNGTVYLQGRDVTSFGSAQRARSGLGRSFQDARLFPSLTVAETIAVSLERFTSARDPISAALHLPRVYESERKIVLQVAELVDIMGLGAYENKFISELSTGTRRMVDLACVIAHRPLVVLLDEPSSGIAQKEAEALVPVLRRIRDEMGSSLVVIEHDIGLLSDISDQFIALDQGSVIARGTPSDVLNDPLVISSYLGSSKETIQRSGTL